MDNDIIQAYLWQDVINLGFSPKSPKEMKKWLSAYGRSLREFWGIYEDPKNPVDKKGKIEGTIHYSEINILFDYSISPNPATIPKFTITLFYCSNTNDLMWVHDFDDQYFSFPIQSIYYNQDKFQNQS
ncbi:MAG: hypothetical protein HN417_09530, partial [Desulfobacula sp.]|nr:hypothetical protein [Desulfobacula sp.]